MKIIKEGIMPPPKEIPPTKVYTNECHVCGTIYEFTEQEGRKGSSVEMGYDLILECPFCHRPNVKCFKYA